MIIDGILKREKRRNEHMQMVYSKELAALPKGSLFVKEQGGKTYCYLKFRKDGKVVSEYVGSGEQAINLKKAINRKKHIMAMLKVLKAEHERIIKMEKVK